MNSILARVRTDTVKRVRLQHFTYWRLEGLLLALQWHTLEFRRLATILQL
jgi:hypothetical protein